ncbi:MAG: metallophosphoesterase [Nanoarchaeota archaeon]
MKIEYFGKCLLIIENGETALVVGDLHLGYESGTQGLVKGGMFDEKVVEFEAIFKKVGRKVDKIILLGDVKHGFSRGNEQEWEEVRALMRYLKEGIKVGGEIIVLKGNHDNYLENITGKITEKELGRIVEVKDCYLWKEIMFVHGDRDFEEIWNDEVELVICGHVHPVINLEKGAKRERYKCYMFGEIENLKKKGKKKKLIVVPSFIENERGVDVREITRKWPWKYEINKFEIKVVGDDGKVFEFGKTGKIK